MFSLRTVDYIHCEICNEQIWSIIKLQNLVAGITKVVKESGVKLVLFSLIRLVLIIFNIGLLL